MIHALDRMARAEFIPSPVSPPVMYDDHLLAWRCELARRAGGHERLPCRPRIRHDRPLTQAERAQIDRLRPTHTLAELGEMFQRHPATIADACTVRVDFRGKRRRGRGRAA